MPRSKNPGSPQGQGNGSTKKGRLSKTEAVRQALAELGQDAKAIKIQAYLKDQLDIEMTTKQITDARSQILRKAARQGKATEATTRPQEGGMASIGITKLEGVRRALDELGPDAKPLAIRDYLQDQFDMEISRDLISVYKRDLKAESQEKARPREQPGAADDPAAPSQQSGPALAGKGQGGIPLPDILTIKDLVERLGAGPLHTLIDAFAR